MKRLLIYVACAFAFVGTVDRQARADITNFLDWHPIADPADPGFSSTATASAASLFALDQPIAAGVDIGFASIDGSTVASSSDGNYFSSESSFSIAIDYRWEFAGSPQGILALGFGIGEDVAGENSAGIGVVSNNGSPFLTYAGGARVNDADLPAEPLTGTPAELEGTLFVSFDAPSGDVTVGASTSAGAGTPDETRTFAGVQNLWAGDDLMVSFFMRSDQQFIFPNWQGGQSEAVFSNFRLLSGTAVAIPEPSSAMLLSSLGIVCVVRRRRRPVG
ncbi:PEP-CTERM sorting domain-containing protein [Stieleria sp. JC731]|uniref:PEP-CTERM sorting domain-containing protein n=1 Tax=Pirellulaceae TaxID=2691357 RepID=UPI001E3A53E3|nr:PEP-CTERM sorting domain-containing protein [Stieleria sp. JC731]MCC9600915.1 PEP-CTERM sorting domain-containing protein [Stieleria sp. JC731]